MKCNKAMEIFLDQERASSLSPKLRVHLFFCPSCRNEVLRLKEAYVKLSGSSLFRMEESQASVIMKIIKNSRVSREHTVSSKKWLMTGAVIIFSIFLIPFNDSIRWLRNMYGIDFELPFVIILGLVVTIYPVLFTATHMDEIKELIKIIDRKIH
jgi:predicted anti-sigma-YlaC factor YlaD